MEAGNTVLMNIKCWGSMGLPSAVICYSLLLKMAIEIVSFPIKNGGSFP